MHRHGDLARHRLPARRDLRRGRHQLRPVLRGRRAGRAVPVRQPTARRPRPASTCPRSTASSGTATCRGSAPASATASGCTGPYDPAPRPALQPAKLLLDPYAKAVEGQVDWDESLFGYRFADPNRAQRRWTPAPHALKSVVINPFFDWQNDRHPAHAVPRDGDLRGARQGPDDDPPGHPRGDPRHLRRHRAPGDHRAPAHARRHRHRADAGAPVRPGPPPGRARPVATTGATTPSASSRRTTPTRPAASAASRCWSSRRWSASCTPPASR